MILVLLIPLSPWQHNWCVLSALCYVHTLEWQAEPAACQAWQTKPYRLEHLRRTWHTAADQPPKGGCREGTRWSRKLIQPALGTVQLSQKAAVAWAQRKSGISCSLPCLTGRELLAQVQGQEVWDNLSSHQLTLLPILSPWSKKGSPVME